MTLHLPGLVYDCVSCGKGCTMFEVELMPYEVKPLEESPVTRQVRAEGYEPLRVLESGRTYLGKKSDSTCIYLNGDKLCRIHAEQGYEAKPWTCQAFPFAAEPTPDGVYMGLSFACTAVVRQLGRPLEEQRPELTKRYGGRLPEAGWVLWGEVALEWERYREIEARVRDGLARHGDLGLLQAAAALCLVVHTGDWGALEADPPLNPAFGACADNLLSGLITLVETAGDPPERIEQVLVAFAQGGRFYSNSLEREVVLSELSSSLPDWYAPRVRQYLEHLLFRKSLLRPPDVLSRVCLLPLVAHAVRFFTLAAAGGALPEIEHWEAAVGILEGRLMFHSRGMESYFQRIARGFLEAL